MAGEKAVIDRTFELSRRGFFGAASAALVAAVAPKRAYSFLTANPVGGFWIQNLRLWKRDMPFEHFNCRSVVVPVLDYITIDMGFSPIDGEVRARK